MDCQRSIQGADFLFTAIMLSAFGKEIIGRVAAALLACMLEVETGHAKGNNSVNVQQLTTSCGGKVCATLIWNIAQVCSHSQL